ncbi:hypothetical protein, partial [Shouchella clausii]
MRGKLSVLLILIIVALVIAQLDYFNQYGTSGSFIENLLVGITIQIAGVLFISFFVDVVLSAHEESEREKREEFEAQIAEKVEWDKFDQFAKRKYFIMINNIAKEYLQLLTKQPVDLEINKDYIDERLSNIDHYFSGDFLNEKVEYLVVENFELAKFSSIKVPHMQAL